MLVGPHPSSAHRVSMALVSLQIKAIILKMDQNILSDQASPLGLHFLSVYLTHVDTAASYCLWHFPSTFLPQDICTCLPVALAKRRFLAILSSTVTILLPSVNILYPLLVFIFLHGP